MDEQYPEECALDFNWTLIDPISLVIPCDTEVVGSYEGKLWAGTPEVGLYIYINYIDSPRHRYNLYLCLRVGLFPCCFRVEPKATQSRHKATKRPLVT